MGELSPRNHGGLAGIYNFKSHLWLAQPIPDDAVRREDNAVTPPVERHFGMQLA
jgi:hypothetical protein